MKLFLVLSAVAAVALARPGIIAPIQHQFHAQDELGQYTYGYSGGPSAKVESRSADGITKGSYSYVDSNGIIQNVNYVADPVNGFRVAATNLPVAPAGPAAPAVISAAPVAVVDTAEVAAAKAEHLAIKAQAEAAAVGTVAPAIVAEPAPAPVAAAVVAAPLPVVETPEVTEAKARHLAAVASAKTTIIDDSAITDDGSYKLNPLEDDGEYRGEKADIVLAHSPVGPVAAVVTNDDSFLHDDGSYKPNPLEDDGSYKGEVAVIGTKYINTIVPPAAVISGNYLPNSYAYAAPVARYAVAATVLPNNHVVSAPAIAATHSQFHAQDELGQYSYGYTGATSAKHETKTADGITRGGYSYIDANGIVQSVNYVSDPVNGFRVAATNLPVAQN